MKNVGFALIAFVAAANFLFAARLHEDRLYYVAALHALFGLTLMGALYALGT